MTGPRMKIGVLIDAVHELYQAGVWKGIVSHAKKYDLDLVTFVGTTQDGTADFESGFDDRLDNHFNVVSDFAVDCGLDGIIILTSPITTSHGREYVKKLCARFGELPLVCVSEKVPGYHHVVVDNASGIEATIAHLVTVHNLRSIAFIKGPNDHNEAQERYAAYKRGLAANNLEYRPELVLEGGFISRDGVLAVRNLIQRNLEFDGIVAVNDYSAFGALEELSKNGVLVPTDVAVTGFDDVPEAARVTPSLATVRQPLESLGQVAVESILAQLGRMDFSMDTVLPTEAVHRRSCGCFSKRVLRARTSQVPLEELTMERVVIQLWQVALENVHKDATAYPGDIALRELIESLVGSLVWDVQRPVIRHIFLNEVDILLYRAEHFSDTDALMFALLRELSVHVGALFEKAEHIGEANNLLEQAGAFIREQLAGRVNRTRLIEEEFQHRIAVTCQRLVHCFDFERLKKTITKGFPELGIRSFALWKFKKPILPENWTMPDMVDLVWAYRLDDDGNPVTVNDGEMPACTLIPEAFRCANCNSHYIFMPYHVENQYIGFAMYEYSPDAPLFMYENLRGHLSAAMTACSFKEIVDAAQSRQTPTEINFKNGAKTAVTPD
ncbi:MAG: substrate-binding domain-containing protein [Deltaproteobacteria bacterium]|nr:substrate-binding domain-containing protein [Deltaproteobacteria bacterium]